MSTTFGIIKNPEIIKLDPNKELIWSDDYEFVDVAKRIGGRFVWKNDIAELLPNYIKVYSNDNGSDGIKTIGCIKREIAGKKNHIISNIMDNIGITSRLSATLSAFFIDQVIVDDGGKSRYLTDEEWSKCSDKTRVALVRVLETIHKWCLEGCPDLDNITETINSRQQDLEEFKALRNANK